MSDTQGGVAETPTEAPKPQNVVAELRELLALAEAGKVRSLGVITIEQGHHDGGGEFNQMRASFNGDGTTTYDLLNLVAGANQLQATILGELRGLAKERSK